MDEIHSKTRRYAGYGWMLAALASLVIAMVVGNYDVARAEQQDTDGMVPVSIVADGDRQVMWVPAGTVADALDFARVSLGRHDRTEPSLDAVVQEFDRIQVLRREVDIYTVEEAMPFQRIYVYDLDVGPGEEVVETMGENGLRTATYMRLMHNGLVDDEVLLEENVTRPPVNERVLMGFRMIPVSPFNFEAEFNENGEPINAVMVHRAQRATGYTAPQGATTSTGRPAMVGHVAVDPRVIPYGSRLFIQSADGRFVYGYAVAADTGSSLMRGTIGVDLYFNTRAECVQNGVRTVDIFVLP